MAVKMGYPELTLGPVLFNWKPEEWRDFYFRIADEAPVNSVCVGEVVCSKRSSFTTPYIPEVVERLTAAGKEVIFSSLSLIMSRHDMSLIHDVIGMEDVLIEANDVSVLSLLNNRPHVVGPLVNVYNEGALRFLQSNGAIRVTLPVEMSLRSIAALNAEVTGGPELEVFAYGRLPLAISARCYHARAHGLRKDSCQYVCGYDRDGMDVDTLNDEPFLVVNGLQTLSRTCVNLLTAVPELIGAGVKRFRLSPQSWDMVTVSKVFRDVLDEAIDTQTGSEQLEEVMPEVNLSNGYIHGREGINYYTGAGLQT